MIKVYPSTRFFNRKKATAFTVASLLSLTTANAATAASTAVLTLVVIKTTGICRRFLRLRKRGLTAAAVLVTTAVLRKRAVLVTAVTATIPTVRAPATVAITVYDAQIATTIATNGLVGVITAVAE